MQQISISFSSFLISWIFTRPEKLNGCSYSCEIAFFPKHRMDVLYLCSVFLAKWHLQRWVAVMLPLGRAAFWKSMESFFIFLWVPKFLNRSQNLNNTINDCSAVKSHCTHGFQFSKVLYLGIDLI